MKNRTFEVGKIVGQIQGVLDNDIPLAVWRKMSQFIKGQNDEVTEELISFVNLFVPDDKAIKGIIIMNLEDFLSQ